MLRVSNWCADNLLVASPCGGSQCPLLVAPPCGRSQNLLLVVPHVVEVGIHCS